MRTLLLVIALSLPSFGQGILAPIMQAPPAGGGGGATFVNSDFIRSSSSFTWTRSYNCTAGNTLFFVYGGVNTSGAETYTAPNATGETTASAVNSVTGASATSVSMQIFKTASCAGGAKTWNFGSTNAGFDGVTIIEASAGATAGTIKSGSTDSCGATGVTSVSCAFTPADSSGFIVAIGTTASGTLSLHTGSGYTVFVSGAGDTATVNTKKTNTGGAQNAQFDNTNPNDINVTIFQIK